MDKLEAEEKYSEDFDKSEQEVWDSVYGETMDDDIAFDDKDKLANAVALELQLVRDLRNAIPTAKQLKLDKRVESESDLLTRDNRYRRPIINAAIALINRLEDRMNPPKTVFEKAYQETIATMTITRAPRKKGE